MPNTAVPVYVVGAVDGVVRQFGSRSRARGIANMSPDRLVVLSEAELPIGTMNLLYKLEHPEAPVFQQRSEALAAIQGILARRAIPGERPATPQGRAELLSVPPVPILRRIHKMANVKKGAKKSTKKTAKKAAAKSGVRGRHGQFTGTKLFKIQTKNPRREGTSGAASWDLMKNGMSYEQYLEAGGVRRDLEWNIAKGWVEARKA